MRVFQYTDTPAELLTPGIMNQVASIYEYRGKQNLFLEARPDVLSALRDVAVVQSTGASNRIEGICTSDERLQALVRDNAAPRNRTEEEIAGYHAVLSTIHESYYYIPVTPNVVLQLHRDMYRETGSSMGGHRKVGDNRIVEIDANGVPYERFRPMSALETPEAMERICTTLNAALASDRQSPLLTMCQFIFDFICIHPFNDGNGRMSRLLTLLLLYKCGFQVGRYISIEQEIERTKREYYRTLQASSIGWGEGANTYQPFTSYMLGVVAKAYAQLEDRVGGLVSKGLSKSQRVAEVFTRRLGKVTKSDILQECPDISVTTVERALADLVKRGDIERVGGGRSAGYVNVRL